MKWLLLALLILLFLLFIILFTKITIFINYYHHKDNDDLKVEFRALFGLIKYKINVPLIKIDDNSPTIVLKETTQKSNNSENEKKDRKQFSAEDLLDSIRDTKELLEHVFKLHKIVKAFLGKVSIKQFEWRTIFGIGDAAYTGMLTGAFWAIKGSIVGLISHYMKMKQMPQLAVIPHFQQTVSQTQLKCIFQFRIGHAILAGMKLIKFWRGGRPRFRTKPLSVLSGDNSKSV
ncbi:DUF2953 domain-containing protein [Neobacillus sp. PS3-34]|uniref:DUF2953 domain-containing protein n=1 Tax=Neobacillus sp. PS3-34 TaxID=3070678 RepID=UPI0027DFB629|nr:DUF2953 domain-containing protein [Neobacillus sp. PS3-34]WML47292.1 DUF2953 domain-containing protein [Neobacillus sp. PS3-34]